MNQEQLAGLIEALVEVAVTFDTNLTFRCEASNDMLRAAVLSVDHKGCGFAQQSRDSKYVTVECPMWNKKLWEGAVPYLGENQDASGR